MKSFWMTAGVFLSFVSVVRADENPFEAFAKLSQPGLEHKKLEPMAGSWTWTSQFWLKPGDKPLEGKGTAERTWVLGGRFLRDVVESKGGPFGDFSGLGYTGYDNLRKKYTGSWMDSMSTAIAPSFGTLDRDGKVFRFDREDLDPASGKTIKGRDVIKIVSNDEHVMEMYKTLPEGKEFKVMELTFKRAKK